ncbi:MAG: class I SAM-dependent methyltransferase [Verrucomicrobiota bacterium]
MRARTPRQMLAGALTRAERAVRGIRRRLQRPAARGQTGRPNDADEWAGLYAETLEPVRTLNSPVARVLEGLTRPGERVLETGCGSATLSAELAVAGRQIELGDFSADILERARRLFAASGLPAPGITLCDLSQRLPWDDGAVDVTWSSGVLEHWTDEELLPIVREQARITRRRVISLVPHSGSLAYRWGKWIAEQDGPWPYGREIPRATLRPVFEAAGLAQVTEDTVWTEASLNFLDFIDPEVRRQAVRWWDSLPADDPVRRGQGYLLLTVGEVRHP